MTSRRHVQVGDAAVGVDHRQRAGRRRGRPRRRPRSPAPSGSVAEAGEQRAEAVVGADVGGGEHVAELVEQRREERPHDVAEDDRVGDLHHRRLEVHREQHVLGLGAGDLRGEELAQGGDAHDGGVDDLAGEHRHRLLQHGRRAVGGDELDAQRCRRLDRRPTARWSGSRRRVMWATLVFESGDHAPIECGCLRAYSLTDCGARRSELPSRSTGLTAEPLTLS